VVSFISTSGVGDLLRGVRLGDLDMNLDLDLELVFRLWDFRDLGGGDGLIELEGDRLLGGVDREE
jgi:hypothetical protein